MNTTRRTLLKRGLTGGAVLAGGAVLVAVVGVPALATSRRVLAPMGEGPFYPAPAWRERWDADPRSWGADLTRRWVGGREMQARGETLGLEGVVTDSDGRLIDGAEVEVWQCDAMAMYRHPRQGLQPGMYDLGFQGFGASKSDARGALRFRTIRPVPYPGRTPHIHVKLRHASFGELTTQLFVAGDPGNAGDFLWRRVADADRDALAMQLQAAEPASGLRWQVRHTLVVPA